MPPNNDFDLPFTWHVDLNSGDLIATEAEIADVNRFYTTNTINVGHNETIFTDEAKEAMIKIVDERIKELFGSKAYMLGLFQNNMNTGDYDGDE